MAITLAGDFLDPPGGYDPVVPNDRPEYGGGGGFGMPGGLESGPPPDPGVAGQMLTDAQSYADKRKAELAATMSDPGAYTDSSGMPGGSQPVGPIADARRNWDPNWGPPPGGSRTATLNGTIDLTSPAGQIDLKTGQAYVPTAAELGPYAKPADSVVSTTPGISGGGGMPGGSHQLSNDEWERTFRNEFGFYDPRYNSRDAFLLEAQRGDRNIRGVGGGGDQLARMAQLDSDAGRIYGGIKGVGEDQFYNSQMAVDQNRAHNQSIVDQVNALGTGGGGGYAGGQTNGKLGATVQNAVQSGNRGQIDWLKSQLVDVPANPTKNSEAFALQTQMAKDLVTLGVDPQTIRTNGTDLYFTPPSGGLAVIYGDQPGKYISLADWVDRAAQLHASAQAKVAADNAKAQGGGGYGGGSGYAPRGPRAPYTPPQTQTTYPAGNEMIDQTPQGGGFLLPGNNTKPGYYPDVQTAMTSKGGFVNPSGMTTFYTPAGEPYSYYYGSKAATGNIPGDRRGLPY